MKFLSLSFALSFSLATVAAGCADFESPSGDRTESASQSIKGGNAVTGNEFPGTARISVTRPNDEMGNPRQPLDCSGVLVAQNLVLTSAICVFDNINPTTGNFEGTVNVGFGNDGNTPAGGIDADDVELHRYFSENNAGVAQLAIIHLPTDAPGFATPVTINEDKAALDGYAGMIKIVGYGETDEGIGLGARNGIEIGIGAITDEFFNAGSVDLTTCNGDGGAPVFAELTPGTPVLIGITQFQSSCLETQARTRVDRHAVEFLIPYIDQFSGPCLVDNICTTVGCRTPDPDCAENGCEWGNACVEDCPSRDWDCELGSFGGDECEDSGDCEQLGSCIAAVDDAEFLYCSIPCDSSVTVNQCPAQMTCEANACVYGNPSPGSQGFDCTVGDECRSGICEDRICVNECDPGANDCPGDFLCGPSKVQPGTNVCLGENLSGGGGFCNAGGGASGGASLLVLLGLAFIGRRRRTRRRARR